MLFKKLMFQATSKRNEQAILTRGGQKRSKRERERFTSGVDGGSCQGMGMGMGQVVESIDCLAGYDKGP
eukprot:scaffold13863_cov59-Attheya_sp.AAC.2